MQSNHRPQSSPRSSQRAEALTLNLRAPKVDSLALRGESLSRSADLRSAVSQACSLPRVPCTRSSRREEAQSSENLANAVNPARVPLECDDSSSLFRLATRRQTDVHMKAAQSDSPP